MFCHSPTRIAKYVSEYTFSISKNNEQANKQTKTRIKKAKETKEENIISPENWLKKKNCGRPGEEDFSLHPHFRKIEMCLRCAVACLAIYL